MGKKTLYGAVTFKGALSSGVGDPLLTRDSTTGDAGTTTNSLGTLTSGHIFVGNGSNVPTDVAVSGDISISNTGVVAITSGVIVNADINTSAAIAFSKMASLTASRALVSDGSGVVSVSSVTGTELSYVSGVTSAIQTQLNGKQATITGAATSIVSSNLTANRALVSDGSGKVGISSVTSTELGYLSGVTSALQTQINNKLTASVGSPVQGDILWYNGTNWTNLPRGTNGQALYSTAGSIQWSTPTINGIPIGGSAKQVLAKTSGTDFDATWYTLDLSYIPSITSTATELNKLSGVTTTATEFNYVSGVTSAIQTQIDSKLAATLPQNAIFVGNASNIASAYAAGSNGQVLQIVAGVPTWQTISGTGTVTSVAASGGTTGLSFTGSPITTSGTLTLTGTLAVANGGTGATSASSARTNLGALGGSTGATDNAILRADGTGGATVQSSALTIDDSGNIVMPDLTYIASGTASVTFSTLQSRLVLQGGTSNTIDLNNGTTTITGTTNRVTTTSSATNSTAGLIVRHDTSATPAIGIGTILSFETETASGNFEIGATIESVSTDVTSTSEDFDLVFKTMSAGAAPTERIRITQNSGTPVISSIGNMILSAPSGTIVLLDNATTNTVANGLVIRRTTTGTAAVGIGTGVSFQSENGSGTTVNAGTINVVSTDVTAGTEDFDMYFQTMSNGSQTEKLRLTSDGRLYGTALHNNSGSVTGTTNQYIASGTYTPTLTSVLNVAASTSYNCNWLRVGNVVTVSGKIDVDPTASATLTSIGVSLPIASNFTNVSNAGGNGSRIESGAIVNVVAVPDTTNDRIQLDFYPTSGSNLDVYFTFTYLIV